MLIEAFEGFWRGLLHPVLTPSHALALVGLGLLIGQQPADRRTAALGGFVVGLIGGLAALTLAIDETRAGNILLAAAAISGALTGLAAPLPKWGLALLAAAIGVALGLDSPPDVIALAAAYLMLVGIAVGATAGLGAVSGLTALARPGWPRMGVRVLGSWTAASAMLALALRLAAAD
jgi:urease accessory protein